MYLKWQIYIHLHFFSFEKYGFIDFQTQTNYKICTKVRHKIGMFGINFCNHTFALQEHQDFGKLIICEGVEFKFLKKLSPM
jgi:hypothetical protein